MIRLLVTGYLLFFCFSCDLTNKRKIPDIYVQNFDTALKRTNGKWYYKNSLFNVHIVEKSSNGKNILYEAPVIAGTEEGWAFGIYNTGEKLMMREYRKGMKEGLFIQWWPNGHRRYLFHYKKDQMDGQQLIFFPSGQKQQESNYVNGDEEGIQRIWNETGQLISNYTIKHKKLYGVISVKSCLPQGHH